MDPRWRIERTRRIARWTLTAVVAVAMTATGNARAATAPTTGGGAEVLVRFAPGTPASIRSLTHARIGARVERRIPRIGYDVVSIPAGLPIDAALTSYRSDPSVAVAEQNLSGRIALSPSDACHSQPCDGQPGQWHHRLTNTPFGWDAFPGRTFTATQARALDRVTIAVLDTKIDTTHPDFANPGGGTDAASGGQLDLRDARDWVPASRQSGSASYHGTFVAGLAAAATGNGIDVAGVGYAAQLLPLAVVDGSGMTNAADLADAIVYAWQHDARVINLSLGIDGDSQAVHDAIRTVTTGSAAHRASLVVAAAGNNTGSAAFYPGSYAESMSVSGTDADDHRAPCSNHNDNVSVSAPADRLVGLAPMPARVVQAPCGTSAAAPQVSGLAAMLFMQDPSRSPVEVRRIIERSADDLGAPGRDDSFGAGRINIERALRTDGPATATARATVIAAAGGSSTVTATATGARGIRAAELILDRPDAIPIPMRASDGSFGGSTESLVASASLPKGTPAGPHPIWVRAFDGVTWGPATVGVLAVDGRAPVISGAVAQNAVRVTGEPLRVTFGLADDYATWFAHGIEIRSTATNAIVYRDTQTRTLGGGQTYEWLPGIQIPGGHYKIKIAAVDEAGNVASTEIGALVT